MKRIGGWIVLGLLASSCGKPQEPTNTNAPSALVVVSGDGQSGPVGGPLQTPITVKVANVSGAGVPGVTVAFAVTSGGGSVTATSVVSGPTGLASSVWVLGGVLGSAGQRVTVSAGGLPSVTFTATGQVGPPFTLEVVAGNKQTGAVGAPLPDSVRIVLKDQFGNPNDGVPISWQIIAGGGSVSPATTTTDGQGRSAAQLTLGSANAEPNGNQLLVTVPGSGVSGFATATGVLAAGTLSVVAGDRQTGSPGARLLSSLRVVVKATSGTPVQGVTVAWSIVTGSGSLEVATGVTDQTGQVSNRWTLGAAGGVQSIQVSVASLSGPPLTMTATALVPPAGVIEGVAGEPSLFAAPPTSFAAAIAAVIPRRVSASQRTSGPDPFRFRGPVASRITYAKNSLVVRFRSAALGVRGAIRSTQGAATAAASIESRLTRLLPMSAVRRREISPTILAARLTVGAGVDLDSLAAVLAADPSVASVGRDEILNADTYRRSTAFAPTTTPNDPLFPNQSWHYVMIDLPRAWRITTGSASVLVAVLDTGIRFDHPVFAGVLTNDGYDFVPTDSLAICGGGKFDNAGDGDGYDADPTQPSDRPLGGDNPQCWGDLDQIGGHGLHTAGTIGAAGNDGVGGTGVNWNVKIRPIRVLGVGGTGTTFDIAQGVLYAAGLPASDGSSGTLTPPPTAARIINMSLGGECNSTAPSPLRDAIQAATNAGVLVVVSAGNDNTNASSACPAGWPEPLTVAAVGPTGSKASYSNFGSSIDIAAPGGDLGPNSSDGTFLVHSAVCDFRSTPCVPGYARYAGTSMAAPHVAGVAALLVAQQPSLSVAALRDRLLNFAVDLGQPGIDPQFGHGLLNARNSLTQTLTLTKRTFVRLYDARTGASQATVTAASGGNFQFTGIPAGSYFVFAGDDEDADGLVGLAGRRWTALGGATTPTPLETTSQGGGSAFFLLGESHELEPNDTPASAGRLMAGGSVQGDIVAGDPADVYRIDIPAAGTYTFETSGFGGAYCRFALELNTVLTLEDDQGVVIDTNDDIDPQEGVSLVGNRCSRIRRSLTPGTYRLVVRAGVGTNPNNPGIHSGRYRLEARSGQ